MSKDLKYSSWFSRLAAYLQGKMSFAERYRLEKESQGDPFLADALEGLEDFAADEFIQDMQLMQQKIHRTRPDKRPVYLRIAVAVFLFVGLGSVSFWLLRESTQKNIIVQALPDEFEESAKSVPGEKQALFSEEELMREDRPEQQSAAKKEESNRFDKARLKNAESPVPTTKESEIQEPKARATEEEAGMLRQQEVQKQQAERVEAAKPDAASDGEEAKSQMLLMQAEPSLAEEEISDDEVTNPALAFQASNKGAEGVGNTGEPQALATAPQLKKSRTKTLASREEAGDEAALQKEDLADTIPLQLRMEILDDPFIPRDGIKAFNAYLQQHNQYPADGTNYLLAFEVDELGRPINFRFEQQLSSAKLDEILRLFTEGVPWVKNSTYVKESDGLVRITLHY